MFYHIAQFFTPLDPCKDPVAERIAAKKTMWDYFDSILVYIRQAGLTIVETEDDIIRDTIDLLHPHFTGPEIYSELETAMTTFLMEKPKNLQSRFTIAYFKFITAKLKQHGRK